MKTNKNSVSAFTGVALVVALVGGTPSMANATSQAINNGDFQIGEDAGAVIQGWTAVTSRVDLGVTSIAGCLTVDTSDYTTLRDFASVWQSEFGSNNPNDNLISSDPSANNDSADTTASFNESTVTLESRDDGSVFAHDSQFLRLYSDIGSDQYGYVVHGPAVFSEIFAATTIDDLKLDWAATDESDDYKVFGYLLNTDTCAQTEVIDSTGELSAWQNISVAVPADGNYRFVFVSGTFDQSFGGAAGASLYADNVILTPNTERAAAAVKPLGLDLALDAAVGAIVPGGQVRLQGGGLIANSPLALVMRSTPVDIPLNGRTADAAGNFDFLATLPASISPGVHSLTLTGTKPDGQPISDVLYFEVDAAGKLLWSQADTPKAAPAAAPVLARTGADAWSTAGLLLPALALIGFGAARIASRRAKKA